MRQSLPRWFWVGLLLVVLIGAGLRLVAVRDTVVDHPIRNDAAEYYLSAYNLTHNGVYTMSPARLRDPSAAIAPDAFRWPGLPLIIAALMWQWPDHARIVAEMQWLNIACGAATIALVGAAAASALPAWAALAAAGLVAVSPHLISFTVYMLSETPAALLVALMLWMCARAESEDSDRRRAALLGLGLVLGALALTRPIFAAFAPFLAAAAPPGRRWEALALPTLAMALVLAPWLIRNALFVAPDAAPSGLAMTMLFGAYPDFRLAGDPTTFPYPTLHDPNAPAAMASVWSALAEIGRRFAADPATMTRWYLIGKPPYLWQFDNIDGMGDVFVYPVIASPFSDNFTFEAIHHYMRKLHWPIVFSGLLGVALIWAPGLDRLLPWRGRFALRAASLLPVFLTLATIPLNDPARFATPVYPALFMVAVAPLAAAASAWADWRARRAETARQGGAPSDEKGRPKPPSGD